MKAVERQPHILREIFQPAAEGAGASPAETTTPPRAGQNAAVYEGTSHTAHGPPPAPGAATPGSVRGGRAAEVALRAPATADAAIRLVADARGHVDEGVAHQLVAWAGSDAGRLDALVRLFDRADRGAHITHLSGAPELELRLNLEAVHVVARHLATHGKLGVDDVVREIEARPLKQVRENDLDVLLAAANARGEQPALRELLANAERVSLYVLVPTATRLQVSDDIAAKAERALR